MRPTRPTGHVEHVDRHLYLAATPVMADDKGRGGARRIIGDTHAEYLWGQASGHMKGELGRGGIVQHVPHPEQQPMMALLQLGNAEGNAALGVTSRSEERRVGKECRSRWSPYH